VTDASQLGAIYQKIADELANQYVLAYTPSNKKHDGTWRSIVVKVNRPETDARTRSGYFAPAVPR
jgi:Ca-activated chloride channel family protein